MTQSTPTMSWIQRVLEHHDSSSSPMQQQQHLSESELVEAISQKFSWLPSLFAMQYSSSDSTTSTNDETDTMTSASHEGQQQVSDSSTLLHAMRKDLAEFRDVCKSEISKFTCSLLYDEGENEVDEKEEDEVVPGITEEVLNFVEDLSKRPQCWTAFPLSVVDNHAFKLSDAQRKHAASIEGLVPSLAALRVNLHNYHYMGDEEFWMIYFIYLLPKLNDQHDFEVLSPLKLNLNASSENHFEGSETPRDWTSSNTQNKKVDDQSVSYEAETEIKAERSETETETGPSDAEAETGPSDADGGETGSSETETGSSDVESKTEHSDAEGDETGSSEDEMESEGGGADSSSFESETNASEYVETEESGTSQDSGSGDREDWVMV